MLLIAPIIAGTLVEGPGVANLSRLPNLRDLDLAGAKVDDDVMPHIGKITGLERLKLSYTDVTDAGLTNIACLSKLQVLDLSGTDVADAGLTQIAAFTNLRVSSDAYASQSLEGARFGADSLALLCRYGRGFAPAGFNGSIQISAPVPTPLASLAIICRLSRDHPT